MPTYLPTYLPACLPACLPPYLHTDVHTHTPLKCAWHIEAASPNATGAPIARALKSAGSVVKNLGITLGVEPQPNNPKSPKASAGIPVL